MQTISTVTDLRNWILNTNPGNVLGDTPTRTTSHEELLDQLVDALRTADGCPVWGEDWQDWLDARAESVLEEVIAANSHAERAADAYPIAHS